MVILALQLMLKQKLLIFSNYDAICGLFRSGLYGVEEISFYTHILKSFFMKGRNQSNAFPASIEIIMWFSFFHGDNIVYCIDWFAYVKPILLPRDKSYLDIVYNICYVTLNWFANILLKFFISVSYRYWPVVFSSVVFV